MRYRSGCILLDDPRLWSRGEGTGNQKGGRARVLCRNYRGHWSVEHKRFFQFPPLKVEKQDIATWREVEDDIAQHEDYNKYNLALVGRAQVLAKLEEAAKLRSALEEDYFKDLEVDFWIGAAKFDTWIGEVVAH